MHTKHVNYIVNATKNRLRNYKIILSEMDEKKLIERLKDFSDEDFQGASDNLIEAIHTILMSFGVSDLDAYRCAGKWSD